MLIFVFLVFAWVWTILPLISEYPGPTPPTLAYRMRRGILFVALIFYSYMLLAGLFCWRVPVICFK
jgi:hypothetical protein